MFIACVDYFHNRSVHVGEMVERQSDLVPSLIAAKAIPGLVSLKTLGFRSICTSSPKSSFIGSLTSSLVIRPLPLFANPIE